MEARLIPLRWELSSQKVTDVGLDIGMRNIAFTSTHASRLGEEEFFKIIGAPKTKVLTRFDGEPLRRGLPTQLVETAGWFNWMDEGKEDIRLIDFGGAFLRQGPQPHKLNQPPENCAPETLLTGEFDWRVDLWSVGITVSINIPRRI